MIFGMHACMTRFKIHNTDTSPQKHPGRGGGRALFLFIYFGGREKKNFTSLVFKKKISFAKIFSFTHFFLFFASASASDFIFFLFFFFFCSLLYCTSYIINYKIYEANKTFSLAFGFFILFYFIFLVAFRAERKGGGVEIDHLWGKKQEKCIPSSLHSLLSLLLVVHTRRLICKAHSMY